MSSTFNIDTERARVLDSVLDRLEKWLVQFVRDKDLPYLFSTGTDITETQDTGHRHNRGNPKHKWDEREVRAIERHMMRFIHTCKVPQKMDCLNCINAEPYALKDRNWTGVKNYVRNRITALKRKACAK